MNAEHENLGGGVIYLEDLMRQHETSSPPEEVWQVRFHDLPEGLTAYNASSVFVVDQTPHILARTEVEGGDGEFTSKVSIFRCSPDMRDCWPTDISNLPELTNGKITQDPSIARINGNWIITWVEVTPNDINDPSKGSVFKSVILSGETIDTLKPIAETSNGVKGVRCVELPNHQIGVTTRPFIDGVGKTCFTVVDSLEDITKETLATAKVVEGAVTDVGWGGSNELIPLANGDIAVLGHTARFVPQEGKPDARVYDVVFYVITPELEADSSIRATAKYYQIIATAEDFMIPETDIPPKRPDLVHVAYPSCIILRNDGESAILLTALRDSGQIGARISDPLALWRAVNPTFANNPLYKSDYHFDLAA